MPEFNIIDLFKKPANKLEKGGSKPSITDDREQCPCCKKYERRKEIVKNNNICSFCDYHLKIKARKRIAMMTEIGSFEEFFSEITSKDFLNFPGYQEKLEKAKIAGKEKEGVLCGTAFIGNSKCAIFAMEPSFMMGSMGSAVGERITKLFEYATEHHLPVVGFTLSGGARMQEGILSLMQMAKISGAIHKHSKESGLYITVLCNPTTGGVTASFAMLGDIILAEPKATVGFAGKRVIEQTTKKKLAPNFQSAEFVESHGFIDAIVHRNELKTTLERLLTQHSISQNRR